MNSKISEVVAGQVNERFLEVRLFGVVATGMTGGTDVTSALASYAATAASLKVPLFIPASENGQPYKLSSNFQMWTGARIVGLGGAVLDFQTDHSAAGINLTIGASGAVSDVHLINLRIISSNSTARNGVYGLISLFDSSDVLIQDCWIGSSVAKYGGESTGIFLMNSKDVRIVRPHVQNTLADGIHISRGSERIVVDHPTVIGAQDDAVAVVSVKQDGSGPTYGPCKYVQIIQPIVRSSTTLGSGVALVGAQDCSVVGGSVDGVPHSIVYIAAIDQGGVINPARLSVSGVVGVNSTFISGAVIVSDATDVTLSSLNLSSNNQGIVVINSDQTSISGCIVRSTSETAYGIYDDNASSRTLVTGCVLHDNDLGATLLTGTGSTATANITT